MEAPLFKCGHPRAPGNISQSYQYQTRVDGQRRRYESTKCYACKLEREARSHRAGSLVALRATRNGYGL